MLIPQPGKDLQQSASYRPISLLNYDLKILTKILATRLIKVLPFLINIDQTHLMSDKSTDINLRGFLTHLQLSPGDTDTRVLVALHIQKASDSVNWHYMATVLAALGFSPSFHRCSTSLLWPRSIWGGTILSHPN